VSATRSTPTGRRPRALVTGGAGFIGSHLVDRLIADGRDVLVVDDLSTGRPSNLAGEARLEQLDVATADLDRVVRTWRPREVYHLAAQSSVPRSIDDPARDFAVNDSGTQRIASASRAGRVDRLIFVSSGGAIYGETPRAASERNRPAPISPYGVHKLAAEGHVARAGLPFAIARPSNVYGPRQAAGLEGAVVAAFVDQALGSGSLTIHGDGRQSRDFVHVRDVTDALLLLGRPETPSGRWNVSTGRAITIGQLASIVERAAGRSLGRHVAARREGDVRRSAISSARLRALGWRPSVDLKTGIAELIGARRGF